MLIHAANAFHISSHWFVLTTRKPESISNPTSLSSFESDDSFPGQLSFLESFETEGSYICNCNFAKLDKYSSSQVSLSSVPLFSYSKALFVSSDFDIFMLKLVLSSKFLWTSLSLLDILYNKPLSTFFFLIVITSMVREINNFLF